MTGVLSEIEHADRLSVCATDRDEELGDLEQLGEAGSVDDVTGVHTCIDQYPRHDLLQSLSNTKKMMSLVLIPALISTCNMICFSL